MPSIFSKLLLSLFFFIPLLPLEMKGKKEHPLHVSTTEISFNGKEKSLEISCRLFTDDFEDALAKVYKVKTDLNKPAMHQAMDELIKKYLATHLQYNVNGKTMEATYIGFENDIEVTNVYLEITNVSSLQKLSLSNSILFEMFDDQMNILHVEKAGVRKSARVNYPKRDLSVSF